ncbi:metallophosphoesterase family protein [Stieleria varia]|uniref:Putative metallophosphoesterase YhaO n=1 Tax=Stieleria varia TaxID=2528005 RepID=A0A5C6AQM7_9BACT|nr:DNA repair exonuclease [Stieleria varia]TWU02343.1 putative metallophosphoesterase YhaO [Stieleria varia]
MTRKILHAADIHLDSPLQKLDRYDHAPVQRIRSATRAALRNLTELAISENVDLVVIAGDLYDGDWTDQNTGLAFVEQASTLVRAGIPMLVIRGNHDAANLMTSSLPLPSNPDGSEIFLSHDAAESRFFEPLGIVVHGMSFRSRAEKRNLAAKYPDPVSGLFNLGLLHTGLEGDSVHGNYAPCTAAQLTDKGYDYWALGHIHTRADLKIGDGPPIVFSGNIQGRHIREQGEKGCVIIDVDSKNQCEYQFHSLDVLRWFECQIDVTAMTQQDEVLDSYQDWITERLETADGRLLIPRVRLIGESPLHMKLHQNQANLVADLQAISVAHGAGEVWLEDLRVRTTAPTNRSVSVDLEGPMESLNHVLRSLGDDEDLPEIITSELEGLMKKLPKELRGSDDDAAFPVDDKQWMSQLLESATADVMARMDAAADGHTSEAKR